MPLALGLGKDCLDGWVFYILSADPKGSTADQLLAELTQARQLYQDKRDHLKALSESLGKHAVEWSTLSRDPTISKDRKRIWSVYIQSAKGRSDHSINSLTPTFLVPSLKELYDKLMIEEGIKNIKKEKLPMCRPTFLKEGMTLQHDQSVFLFTFSS